MSTLALAVILGSTRQQREGEKIAQWVVRQAEATGSFSVDYIDLAQVDLDPVQSQHHPRSGKYSPGVQAFADRVAVADAYLVVTPEYNHGYPAALKHALDSCYAEWNGKAIGIVSYGGISGGIRSAEQLRQVFGELRLAVISEPVMIPMARDFPDDGPADDEPLSQAAQTQLRSLAWWAGALHRQRTQHPYPS